MPMWPSICGWRAQGARALIHMGAHGTLEWLPGKAVALSGDCWLRRCWGDAGDLSLHRQRSGRSRAGETPHRGGDPGPYAAPHAGRRPASRHGGAGAVPGRIFHRRRAGPRAPRPPDRPRSGTRRAPWGSRPIWASPLRPARPRRSPHRPLRLRHQGKPVRRGAACLGQRRLWPDRTRRADGRAAGRFVAPGPSGSPNRGRSDVMPTGRNLFSVDPRAVPTPSAHAQGVKAGRGAAAPPPAGSRRLAARAGRGPLGQRNDAHRGRGIRHGPASGRAEAGLGCRVRPRLGHRGRAAGPAGPPAHRRDAAGVGPLPRRVPVLAQLFQTGAATLAARDEAPDQNPYAGGARVFGPQPGNTGWAWAPRPRTSPLPRVRPRARPGSRLQLGHRRGWRQP